MRIKGYITSIFFCLIMLVASACSAVSVSYSNGDGTVTGKEDEKVVSITIEDTVDDASAGEISDGDSGEEFDETGADNPEPEGFSEKMLDPELVKYLKAELGMSDDDIITQEIAESVTDISAYDYELSHLDGLEYFANLKNFATCYSYVDDISVISKLTKLRNFQIGSGRLLEIPDLSANEELIQISLTGCGIEDISMLVTAPNLKYVSLDDNNITSIAPIKEMTTLEAFDISNNPILDYRAVLDNASLVAAIEYCDFDIYKAIEAVDRAKEIVAELITDDMPLIQKEYHLFEYVRENTTYKEVGGIATPFGYECIVKGRGVCGHFADGLTLLLQVAGIEANSIGSDTHAWTYVNVDGRWYHCDALWDQGCGDYPCYFNLGSETVLNTAHHVYKTELIPTAELEDMDVSEYIDYLDIVR